MPYIVRSRLVATFVWFQFEYVHRSSCCSCLISSPCQPEERANSFVEQAARRLSALLARSKSYQLTILWSRAAFIRYVSCAISASALHGNHLSLWPNTDRCFHSRDYSRCSAENSMSLNTKIRSFCWCTTSGSKKALLGMMTNTVFAV